MIEISPRKLSYFDQIIFNMNKGTFESFFAFPRLHCYYIKSYRTQTLNIARLNSNQDISQI